MIEKSILKIHNINKACIMSCRLYLYYRRLLLQIVIHIQTEIYFYSAVGAEDGD